MERAAAAEEPVPRLPLSARRTVPRPPNLNRPATSRPYRPRTARSDLKPARAQTARQRPQTARQAHVELPGPKMKQCIRPLMAHRKPPTTEFRVLSPCKTPSGEQTVRLLRSEPTRSEDYDSCVTPWRQPGWSANWGSHEPECLINLRKVAWGVEECQDRWYVTPYTMRMWVPGDGADKSWDWPCVRQMVEAGANQDVEPFAGASCATRPEVMCVFNLSSNYLHAVDYWDSSAHIEDKVAKMSELLVHAMSSTLIGARERPARPRKIGFADKEVAGRIHVSLAQINIAVKYEKLQHAGLDSMAKVFSYFARCKNGTQSPYHDVPSLSAISEWETARQFYMSVGHFQSVPSLPLRQAKDVLGICLIGDQGAETRYFVVLGHHDPDDETKNYTYGAVMYDSVEDILQHVPSGKRRAGYGTGLAMILYDARCVPFDDIASYEEMGLIDPTNRAPLHPIPVEFSLSPFDDPKPYVQGRFGFDYFFNITDKDLLWFEILFKLLNEKNNYKLVDYIPSRMRLSLSTGEAVTMLVKGNEDNIVAQHTRMVDQLSHVAAKGSRKPASRSNRNSSIIKSGSTPSRSRENSVLIEPSRANKLQDKHRVGNLARRTSIEPKKSRQNSVTCDTGGLGSLVRSKNFLGKLKGRAIAGRLHRGDMDAVPALEHQGPERTARPKKLEAMLTRLCAKGQNAEAVPIRQHEKPLIVPAVLAEQKSHLVNLENAAAMLVDKYKSPQTQLEIKHVEDKSHFQPKLKVIRHEGVRHARPVVKSEAQKTDSP